MSDGGNTTPRIVKSEHIGPNDTGDNIEAKRVANYVWNGSTWERQSPTAASTGLTDAELRATPVPVSGTVTANPSTYAIRIDEASATVTYIGDAAIGSATSSAVWRVKKIDTTSGTAITFADGNGNFDNIFDNRASLTYS